MFDWILRKPCFFDQDITDSRWFWEGVFYECGLLLFLGIIVLNRGWGAFASSWPFVVTIMGIAIGEWAGAIRDYRRVRTLDLDWRSIEPGSPLHILLGMQADRIKQGSLIISTLALVIVLAV